MSDGHSQRQFPSSQRSVGRRRRPSGLGLRVILAVGIIAFSCISYLAKTDTNKVTGENQRVSLSEADEIQLGLNAAPRMIREYGGLHSSRIARNKVATVGRRLCNALSLNLAKKKIQIPYQFDFHLLADEQTINAFALPGGQIFITFALYDQLETDGQLAGVLGHEIGHVIERHGSVQMAKQGFFQGLAGAAAVVGGDDNSAQMAQMVARFTLMKYGRDDELESDRWGVMLTSLAGYDPTAMLGVMDILDRASADGGPPEMMRTHPKPANRKSYIEEKIREYFPDGIPPGLQK